MKLQAPKGKTAPLMTVHYPKKGSSPAVSERNPKLQPTSQPANSFSSSVPDSNVEPVEAGLSQEGELLRFLFVGVKFQFSY